MGDVMSMIRQRMEKLMPGVTILHDENSNQKKSQILAET
jgi:hypothetical protein